MEHFLSANDLRSILFEIKITFWKLKIGSRGSRRGNFINAQLGTINRNSNKNVVIAVDLTET